MLLEELEELEDATQARAALARLASGWLDESLVEPAARCAVLLEAGMSAAVLPIIRKNMRRHPVRCVRLLRTLTAELDGGETPQESAQLREVLAEILGYLRGALPPAAERRRWWAVPQICAELGADLLAVLLQIDAGDLLPSTLAWMCADRDRWPIDDVLLPALLALHQRLQDEIAMVEEIRPLRAVCLAHLDARIAEPLAPFPDWARRGLPPYRPPHSRLKRSAELVELHAFLVDPAREQWELWARKEIRTHIKSIIQWHQLDVKTSTLRTRIPYTLVCVKTSASYERRKAQRQDDLKLRAALMWE